MIRTDSFAEPWRTSCSSSGSLCQTQVEHAEAYHAVMLFSRTRLLVRMCELKYEVQIVIHFLAIMAPLQATFKRLFGAGLVGCSGFFCSMLQDMLQLQAHVTQWSDDNVGLQSWPSWHLINCIGLAV